MDSYVMFCSSDSRPVYIQDIKRAIAMPSDFIIEFRYQEKHVDSGLLDKIKRDPQALYKKKAFIAYTTGNSVGPNEDTTLSHCPVRFVEIKKAFIHEETSLVWFCLKLGDFCSCQSGECLPTTPSFCIKEIAAILCKTSFKTIANSLSFPQTTLVHISGIYRIDNNERLCIKDDPDDECSYFEKLREGKRYKLEVSAYSTSSNISYDLESSSAVLFDQKAVKNHEMSIDRRVHKFRALRSEDRTSQASIIVNAYDDKLKLDYDVMLNCKISKSFWNSFLFGLLATLSAIGVFLVTSARTEVLKVYEFSWLQLGIGGILLCVVAGSLYLIYNKK